MSSGGKVSWDFTIKLTSSNPARVPGGPLNIQEVQKKPSLSVTSLLSVRDDIIDNMLFRIPEESVTKHVNEIEFIICLVYLGWLLRANLRIIIMKKGNNNRLRNCITEIMLSESRAKVEPNTTAISTIYNIYFFR